MSVVQMRKLGLRLNELAQGLPAHQAWWHFRTCAAHPSTQLCPEEGLREPQCLVASDFLQFSLSLLDFVGSTVSSVLRPGGDVSGWGVLPCPVAHTQGP